MSTRKLTADKLLWESLPRWRRSGLALDRFELLKELPFFSDLSKRQISGVSAIMFERTYEADELIFEEGQPGAALFLVAEGRVAVETSRENRTTNLAILEKGAFFGEMALIDDAPRSADVRALERTRALALYRNDLSELVRRDAQTGCQIFRALASMIGERLRLTNKLVSAEGPERAEAR